MASDRPTIASDIVFVDGNFDRPVAGSTTKALRTNVFSKRSLAGGLLLLILVGEPTIPGANGLYTPAGFLTLYAMYFMLYHLFEALTLRYHLVVYQVILLTFAVYSVLITGFFHAEIADFVRKPQDTIWTILLRTQPSMYIAFGLYLLNRHVPRKSTVPMPVLLPLLALAVLAGLLSLTGTFGVPKVREAVMVTPGLSILFAILACAAVYHALRTHPTPTTHAGRGLTILAWTCVVLGLVPSLLSLVALFVIMTLGGIVVLWKPAYRNLAL